MAEFYSVSLEEMDAFLRPMRFQPVDLTYRRSPVKEWVYQRPVPSRANHFVRVYTGINRYGQQQNQSRGVGKDAIRVQVIYRDEAGFETLVTQPKRVHRVQGWADNLANRLEEINRTRPQVAFDSRGKPMTLRKGKTGWFWGSSDYPRYKETRPFASESDDEWGGLPVHEINSLGELFLIFNAQTPEYRELLRTHLLKINFSGVYSFRIISNASKIMFGRNMLDDLKKGWNTQLGYNEPVWHEIYGKMRGHWPVSEQWKEATKIVSAEIPCIPKYNKSTLEELITTLESADLRGYESNKRLNKDAGPRNLLVFDMKGIVFAFDNPGWGGKLPLNSNWGQLKKGGEIEIVGGIPAENIVYESIPSEPYNYADAATTMKAKKSWTKGGENSTYGGLREIYTRDNPARFGYDFNKIQDYTDEEMIEHWNQFAAEDNYEATYGKAQAKIRRRLKKKIMAQAIMGTKAGQWSARKSQELKRQYEAACEKRGLAAYKGQKTQSQKNLSNWSQQKWRTASGKNSSDTGEPYFPAKAVESLKKKGLYAKAKRQKAAATKAGKQSARYSDDIRAVVRKYRAEDTAIAENWELIEYEGHPALYRKIETADYNTTWQLVEFADDLNMKLKHHATVQFTASSIEIWLWTHDSETITYRDEYWAEAYDELLELATIVDQLEFDSESVPEDWEDIKWKEEKPEHIGDSAEWDSEQGSDWGSLRPMQLNERGDYYPTEEAYIEAMLRRFPKMNIHGERGCPVCGSETLFMRETTGKGLKWRCYGCNYSDESLSEKSQKIDTLEKFGLTLRCPDCGEDFKAYNQEAIRYHQKKCGV